MRPRDSKLYSEGILTGVGFADFAIAMIQFRRTMFDNFGNKRRITRSISFYSISDQMTGCQKYSFGRCVLTCKKKLTESKLGPVDLWIQYESFCGVAVF